MIIILSKPIYKVGGNVCFLSSILKRREEKKKKKKAKGKGETEKKKKKEKVYLSWSHQKLNMY